jgi:hypothetical protein
MLNPIANVLPTMQQAQNPAKLDMHIANTVFKLLHGAYGNLFLSKFATGQLDESGSDKGVTSARKVWAHALNNFGASVVSDSVKQFFTSNPEFPPSLPQLLALCKANKPRAVYVPDVPAIGMGQQLRSQYAAKAREVNARHAAKAIDRVTGFQALPMSLDGLKQAIAGAVGLAGGDESAKLLQLDRMFSAKAAA